MSTTSPSIVAQGNSYYGSDLQVDLGCITTQLRRIKGSLLEYRHLMNALSSERPAFEYCCNDQASYSIKGISDKSGQSSALSLARGTLPWLSRAD